MGYYRRRRMMRLGGVDAMRATDPYRRWSRDEYQRWSKEQYQRQVGEGSLVARLRAVREQLDEYERGLLLSLEERANLGDEPTGRQIRAALRALRRIEGCPV
jgi:hypothetical protein